MILDKGEDDAIKRAEAYLQAGSDGVLIHSKSQSENEIFNFIKRFRMLSDKTLIVVPTTYNHVQFYEYENADVDIVIYANHLLEVLIRQ